jgi:hypothetical protein
MAYQLSPGLAGLVQGQGAEGNFIRGEDGRLMVDQNMHGQHAMLLQLQNMQPQLAAQLGAGSHSLLNGQAGHSEAAHSAAAGSGGLPGGFFLLQDGANQSNSLARCVASRPHPARCLTPETAHLVLVA